MVQVAILGFGTVGSGVAEVLTQNRAVLAEKAGEEIRLKYILDTREFPGSPFEAQLTHNFEDILNDPEVKVVAECIGGATIALEFVKKLLAAGKHVATSNKEMVATHGHELLELAKAHNVNFFFEASVGGGIPLLRPLACDLAGNQITEVTGILNGTTNYILSEMLDKGAAFDTALQEAQAMGYAERNPAADVEGLDACRKVCILSALAFGFHVYPDLCPTQGITTITEDDVAAAASAGMKVKLLGRTLKTAEGKVCAFVAPHFVPASSQLYHVDGVFNGVVIRGNAIGEAMFYGPGAGKLPTASAVVGDMVDAVWHLSQRRRLDWADARPDQMADPWELPLTYVVRTTASLAEVEAALGQAKALDGNGYLLAAPTTRRAIEQSGLALLAVRPVFQ